MGFYVANEHQAVAEPRLRRQARQGVPRQSALATPGTPLKKSRLDFFSSTRSSAGFFASQPVEPHREKRLTPTKTASGVRYYGYRYYSPSLGRWLSRDPIGEEGGFRGPSAKSGVILPRTKDDNTYAFLSNKPISKYDILGLACGPDNWMDWLIPDAPFGFDFESCCRGHDACYSYCLPQGKSKASCDEAFLTCMRNNVESQSSWIKPGWLGQALAETYAAAVSTCGCGLFTSAQSSCRCPGKCDN